MRPIVVHLVEDLALGGMERVVESLALMTRADGGRVRVVCARGGGPVADSLRAAGVDVDVLDGAGGLSRLLRRQRPFILHAHGAAAVMGRLAGRWAGARAVITHLHRTERFGWRRRLLDRLLPADATLACSMAALADFESQEGPGAELLYNPVDSERLKFSTALRSRGRAALGVGDARPVILMIGRFVPLKGHDALLAAMPRVLAARPEALFVFIGDGPERGAIQAAARKHGEAARFLGLQPEVLPFLCACDVYVQPSTGREAMSVATLEALSCSRAVVATELEGFFESVSGAGILVRPEDPAALAGAIVDLLAKPEAREELGRKARRRVEESFSSAVVARRLQAIYERLASG